MIDSVLNETFGERLDQHWIDGFVVEEFKDGEGKPVEYTPVNTAARTGTTMCWASVHLIGCLSVRKQRIYMTWCENINVISGLWQSPNRRL